MAFPRQPLLFTERVPHNAYETVEGNHNSALEPWSTFDWNFRPNLESKFRHSVELSIITAVEKLSIWTQKNNLSQIGAVGLQYS